MTVLPETVEGLEVFPLAFDDVRIAPALVAPGPAYHAARTVRRHPDSDRNDLYVGQFN